MKFSSRYFFVTLGLLSTNSACIAPPCFWANSCLTFLRVAAKSTLLPACSSVKTNWPALVSNFSMDASLPSWKQVFAASVSLLSPSGERSATKGSSYFSAFPLSSISGRDSSSTSFIVKSPSFNNTVSSLKVTVISSPLTASSIAPFAISRASSLVLPPIFMPPISVPSGNTVPLVTVETSGSELSSASFPLHAPNVSASSTAAVNAPILLQLIPPSQFAIALSFLPLLAGKFQYSACPIIIYCLFGNVKPGNI